MAGEDLSRQTSTSSRKSWRATSVREMFNAPDVFQRSSRRHEINDEEELKWAAIERLPTYDRLRKGMLKQVMTDGNVVHDEVDVTKLGPEAKKQLMGSILKVVEEDNERFLTRLRSRTDRLYTLFFLGGILSFGNQRNVEFVSYNFLCFGANSVGIQIPKIEVRFQNLSVEGDGFVGTRALPTLIDLA